MKRDVDLIRQLLLEIERHGAECAVDVLVAAAASGAPEANERTRYHVRLSIDAGLAKEAERTAAGIACVRLTCAGHEFLDLCRGEARWREAKWIVHEQTGGLSLAVLRAVLTKWAVDGISRRERVRRWRRSMPPYYVRGYYGEPVYAEPAYRVESYRYEREPLFEEEPVRLVHPRREYRESVGHNGRWEHEAAPHDPLADEPLGISLPVHMI